GEPVDVTQAGERLEHVLQGEGVPRQKDLRHDSMGLQGTAMLDARPEVRGEGRRVIVAGRRAGADVRHNSNALRGAVGDLLRQALTPVVDAGQRVREVKRLLGVEDRAETELLRQVHRDVLREGYRAGVRLHPTALRLESLVPGDDVEEILAL